MTSFFAPSPGRSRATRRVAAASLVAASAVLLSGCFGIVNQTTAQRDVTGDVRVTTDLCVNNSSPNSVNDDAGCVISDNDHPYDLQLFYAYLIPDGADEPDTIQGDGALEGITFTKSPEYAQIALDRWGIDEDGTGAQAAQIVGRITDPEPEATTPPVVHHWVAYQSGAVPRQVEITEGKRSQLTADFGTAALSGPEFSVRTVSSWRWVREAFEEETAWPADRAIECGRATDFNGAPVYSEGTECGYSVWPNEGWFQATPINTLSVDAAETGTVVAGGQLSFAFPATSTLAGSEPVSVPVAATTTVPGATVVADSELELGTDGKLAVALTVPAGTPAGEYAVELTAGSDSGARTAKTKFTVKAAPVATTPPAASAAPAQEPFPVLLAKSAAAAAAFIASPESGETLRQGGLTVPFAMPLRGYVRLSLLGQIPKGKKKAPVLAVGTGEADGQKLINLRLKRTKAGKKLLKASNVIHGSLVVRFWGRAGKTITTPVTLTLG